MHCATAYKTITWTITYTAFNTAISAKEERRPSPIMQGKFKIHFTMINCTPINLDCSRTCYVLHQMIATLSITKGWTFSAWNELTEA